MKNYLLPIILTLFAAKSFGQTCIPIVHIETHAFNCDDATTATAELQFGRTPPFNVTITKQGTTTSANYTSTNGLAVRATGLERNATYDVVATNACGIVTTSFTVTDYPVFTPSNTSQPCIGEPYEVCFPILQSSYSWTRNGNTMGKMGDCLPFSNYSALWDGNYHVNMNFANGCVVRSHDFTLAGKNCTLPVKLVTFDTKHSEGINQLRWTTSEESNSDRFEIERSADGKAWNVIGELSANGGTSQVTNYFFSDASYIQGTNYYRLKMIDLDGTFAYSSISGITNEDVEVIVMPNPATSTIQIKSAFKIREAVLSDVNGKTRLTKRVGNITDKLDVRALSEGQYLLKIVTENNQSFTKTIFITR